ncbi:flagellar protein FliT [Pseudomonas alkylphenolica]|uniref:Flagellar protein FliT n=1 Tax=Pseudomonas alkylphenolica TaxID=237609 RepID=A0A443ZNP8_9PSED|nr:flagellar protein FliT [Pseudomonas alkylphenolica]RWU20730.1 flagellar protein FliT [Pseudomonas alkylphenolica]
MSVVLERIEQTRAALLGALASRDWEAISELDTSIRLCVDDVLGEASVNEAVLRSSLEELLGVYRQLIAVASDERQTIVNEMTQFRQAKNAAKVYHLFS